jgi:predicted nucleic acid-binding protein
MAILDTTFLIDLMKESKASRAGPATAKLGELMQRGEELRAAVFTVGELYVGVAKGSQPDKERQAIEDCLALLDIVGFEESTARLFGRLVGQLERVGQVIGDMDALIASVALEQDELLVTRNVAHFQRVPGLRIEGY